MAPWPPPKDAGLKPIDGAILTFVAGEDGGVNGYEFERATEDNVGGVLGHTASSIYRHLKTLKRRGYLDTFESREERPKTMYVITTDGREVAELWLRSHVAFPAINADEVAARFHGFHFAAPSIVWRGLEPLLFELESELESLRIRERRLRRDKEWSKGVAVQFHMAERLIRAHIEALEYAMRTFDIPDPRVDEWDAPGS